MLKVGGVVAVLIFIVGFLSFLSKIKSLEITSIALSGNVSTDITDLHNLIHGDLAGSYAGLFSRSNTVIYPKKKIEQDILSMFKRIETVHIATDGPHTLAITVTERKPAYAWCKGLPTDTQHECYFMDSTGYLFGVAPIFSGNAYVTFYGMITVDDPIGTTFIEPQRFATLIDFITFVSNKGLLIKNVLVKDDSAEISLVPGGKIIIDDKEDLEKVKQNIETLLEKGGILNKQILPTIEYIDFRFGNKVYYKLNNQTNSTITNTIPSTTTSTTH